jgi:salicylate hydroxylase
MASHAPILIAGGGIGGLALAIALAKVGRASIVLERQPEFSAAGAGIQIGPNGMRVLQQLGLDDALRPQAGVPEAIVVHAGGSGRVLARLPLGAWIDARYGAPYWVAHRGDLNAVLVRQARREPLIALRTGIEVAGIVHTGTGITVTAAAGGTVHGAALIGADGLWSTVRAAMAAGMGASRRAGTGAPHAMPVPQFAGATATRTVIPAAAAGRLASQAVGLWLGRDAHVVHYPVREGREIAVVIIAEEAWQGREWEAEADTRRLRARLSPFHPSLTQVLTPIPAWRRWALHTLADLPRWTQGRIALMGDAAHPMLPYLAQGGAFALEDALVLARCLRDEAEIPEALAAYETLRRPRARRAQIASLAQGRLYRLPPPASWVRDAALRILPGALLMQRLSWLHGWRPDP